MFAQREIKAFDFTQKRLLVRGNLGRSFNIFMVSETSISIAELGEGILGSILMLLLHKKVYRKKELVTALNER